jgi:hypothetical protein
MNTSYASFGKAPSLSPEAEAFCADCLQAGYEWGAAGNEKLPASATVGTRQVPIVRSSHEWAREFVKGWKMARQNAKKA